MIPVTYSFPRYLEAKKTVDDRALNRTVWQALEQALAGRAQTLLSRPVQPLQVLEVGAGTNAMLERMLAWGLLQQAEYTAVDAQEENITYARQRLPQWAAAQGWQAKFPTSFSPSLQGGGQGVGTSLQGGDQGVDASLQKGDQGVDTSLPGEGQRGSAGRFEAILEKDACQRRLRLSLETADLFDFIARHSWHRQTGRIWDLLVAHAFLDLMDIPRTLPQLFGLLKPGGLFYFTINFDGLTLLEPEIEPQFDAHIQQLYHRTMDERITGGRPSGDSRAGRRLFTHLRNAGAEILAAGASDWVVFPASPGICKARGRANLAYLSDEATGSCYLADEAYFLHFIINTISEALNGHPELDPPRFTAWVEERHAQVERGELVYIAHQLDFLGRAP